MKIGVVGGREYPNKEYVCNSLTDFIAQHRVPNTKFEIVSGGSTGVDSIAERYAWDNQLGFKIFRPEVSMYKLAAYNIRNKKIAECCDVLLAFPNPKSVGTWNTIRFAFEAGKKVVVYPYPNAPVV